MNEKVIFTKLVQLIGESKTASINLEQNCTGEITLYNSKFWERHLLTYPAEKKSFEIFGNEDKDWYVHSRFSLHKVSISENLQPQWVAYISRHENLCEELGNFRMAVGRKGLMICCENEELESLLGQYFMRHCETYNSYPTQNDPESYWIIFPKSAMNEDSVNGLLKVIADFYINYAG